MTFKSVTDTNNWENDPANDTPVLHPNVTITSEHYHVLWRDAKRFRAAQKLKLIMPGSIIPLDEYIKDNDD